MSTYRGLLHNAPTASPARLSAIRTKPLPRYRCVYCRRNLPDRFSIAAHEVQCDARAIVRRQWAMAIEKFRRRQEEMGRG